MELYRTIEHGPVEVLRCHPGPHTELQTAYTNTIICGNGKTRSVAQVQAQSEPQCLLCVIQCAPNTGCVIRSLHIMFFYRFYEYFIHTFRTITILFTNTPEEGMLWGGSPTLSENGPIIYDVLQESTLDSNGHDLWGKSRN